MKKNLFFLVILVFVFLPGFADVEVYQFEKQPVMISIETGHARDGWTPVFLFTGDLELRLWMDGSSQVWSEMRHNRHKKPLFQIDQNSGGILAGGLYLSGKIEFVSDRRVRIRLIDDLPLYLQVDEQRGVVELGIIKACGSITGFLSESEDGQGKEIYFPGSHLDFSKKLLYRSGEDILLSQDDEQWVLARKSRDEVKEGRGWRVKGGK